MSNAVRVVVRDIAKAGTVLGAALRAGANTAGGVTFGIADSQKARDAALTKAIADATRQAQVVAKAANISFITLQQLRVGGEYEPEAQYYGAADAQMASASRAGTPLRAGQLTIAASVTARFVARERAPVLTP